MHVFKDYDQRLMTIFVTIYFNDTFFQIKFNYEELIIITVWKKIACKIFNENRKAMELYKYVNDVINLLKAPLGEN